MGAQENFYEALDFKYAEVGTAMQVIDRMNPGRVKFSIPVLTPNLNNNATSTNKVIQKSKTNLVNEDNKAVDVSNIEIANYLYIEIPLELCALPGSYQDITGQFNGYEANTGNSACTIEGNIVVNGTARITGSLRFSGSISGTCTPYGSLNGGSFSNTGAITGSTSLSGTGRISGTLYNTGSRNNVGVQSIMGTLGTTLNNKSRYIPMYSKWLIIFIGGDISCPVVVCRLPNDAGTPVTESELITYDKIDQNIDIDKYPDLDLDDFIIGEPDFDLGQNEIEEPEPVEPDEAE